MGKKRTWDELDQFDKQWSDTCLMLAGKLSTAVSRFSRDPFGPRMFHKMMSAMRDYDDAIIEWHTTADKLRKRKA